MANKNQTPKSEDNIVLNEEEKKFIESQRKEMELLTEFKLKYEELVNKTGFTWAVDGNSPLNNIKLGIAKVNK